MAFVEASVAEDVFRDVIVAAPLKPHESLPQHLLEKGLPRRHRRGPIEAIIYDSIILNRSRLPRRHRRGPIEAR